MTNEEYAQTDPEAQHAARAIAIYCAATGGDEAEYSRLNATESAKWERAAIAAHEVTRNGLLFKIQEVVAHAGGDWPDVEGEPEVLRRVKMLARMASKPAAPQGVAYAELPEPIWRTAQGVTFSERQLYDFADRTHALRASNGQAPAGAALEELLILLGNKKAWPSYYFNHKDRYECCDCGEEHDDYAEITHAETCDFTQATADRKRIKELVEILKSNAPTAQAAPAIDYDHGPQSLTVAEAARHVGKWLNERPNRPLDLRDVAMLCAHAKKAPAAGAVAGPVVTLDAALQAVEYVGQHNSASRETEMVQMLRKAATPATQADSQLMLRDWTTSDDPVQALDAIMAIYEKCMGTTPGPEMAHVVSKTKEMLFDWWGQYRERAREALIKAGSAQGLQPVHDAVTIELLNERVEYLEGKLKEADSVLEDAARLKEAVGLLEELAEHDSYSSEYDGRIISLCPECGEQEGEHRPNCAFVRAKTFLAARKQGGTQ